MHCKSVWSAVVVSVCSIFTFSLQLFVTLYLSLLVMLPRKTCFHVFVLKFICNACVGFLDAREKEKKNTTFPNGIEWNIPNRTCIWSQAEWFSWQHPTQNEKDWKNTNNNNNNINNNNNNYYYYCYYCYCYYFFFLKITKYRADNLTLWLSTTKSKIKRKQKER